MEDGDPTGVLAFLAPRAVPGVEEVARGVYRRTLNGSVATPSIEDLVHPLVQEDARAVLARDPALAPLIAERPGLRVPATLDRAELALRAVLGQNVTVAAAQRITERIVLAHGTPLERPDESLTHYFPSPSALAAADPASLPLPRARAHALQGLASKLAGSAIPLAPGADPEEAEARLLALPGIGPWTAGYIRLRALGDRDAFLPGDAVLRRLGVDATRAEQWRPFRALAVIHLWRAASRPPS